MKHHIKNILVCVCLLAIATCAFHGCAFNKTEHIKQEISAFIEENRTDLENTVQLYLRHEESEEDHTYKGHTVTAVSDGEHSAVYILYTCSGMISNETFYDFFYSPDHVPVAPYGQSCTIKQTSNDTWTWEDSDSATRGIIIQLDDNWYYAETNY